MQVAISGVYQGGKVILNELPPNDEPSDVMVVFLPKSLSKQNTTAHNRKKTTWHFIRV